jgi:ribonuclease Z
MVDCGEGSLVQLRKTGVPPASVHGIFVTHLHGDHCFGLASMVAAITSDKRRKLDAARAKGGGKPGGAGKNAPPPPPLRVYGPPGVSELLRAQMVLTGLQRELAMPLLITELVEEER